MGMSLTRYGIRVVGQVEPYEDFETEAEAIRAYEGMKLKHQADEEIVRVDTSITVVRSSEAAYRAYWAAEATEDADDYLYRIREERDDDSDDGARFGDAGGDDRRSGGGAAS